MPTVGACRSYFVWKMFVIDSLLNENHSGITRASTCVCVMYMLRKSNWKFIINQMRKNKNSYNNK